MAFLFDPPSCPMASLLRVDYFFRFLHFVIPATIEKTKPSSVDLFLQSRFQKAYKSTIREDELSKNKSKKLIRKNTLLRSLSENARCIL